MNSKPLRVLIPIFSFGRAGGIRVLSQLANHWNELGCDVTFVAYFQSETPYYPIDVKIIWIDEKGRVKKENNLVYNVKNISFKRAFGLYNFIKKESSKYDVILANSNKSVWPVWLASKSLNFYYVQAYEAEFNNGSGLKGMLKKFSAYLTYYIPINKVVNAEIYKRYKNIKSEYVIPPGLDLEIYHPKSIDLKDKKELVVGCIGRKEEWKGSKDVGQAIEIIRSRGYEIKFKVAFEEIDYHNYELVKPDGDNNLADFYRSLDILVAPGHIQLGAIHYPVIEAMACKVPVVTTGYYPANEKNSYIVPVKRPDKIADTLVDIIKDYNSAIKKTDIASEEILVFDWKVVSANFLNIFQSELGRLKK